MIGENDRVTEENDRVTEENDREIDAMESTVRIADVVTRGVSRRNVLRSAASALAGGGLLARAADEGAAVSRDDGGLDVRTTDVEVLDGGDEGRIRTKGRVGGMSNYDCERCEVGAHVRPVGGDRWYGGLQTVEHTHRDSFWAAVTLEGLRPGKYECRLCACPITHSSLFVANVLLVVVRRPKHGKKKKKLRKAYRKRCPCGLRHPGKYHVMICGGNAHNVYDYAFRATTGDITPVGVSNAPGVIADRHVTAADAEDRVAGRTVTGAVAGGGDSYVCRGELADFQLDRGASVYVNGMDVTGAVGGY